MQRVRDECGDVGEFRLADKDVVLLTGAEANEVFFRASDEELDQAAAYPFMTPVFGEGVVFDATPEERRRVLHNQSLRDKFMRGHAATITAEVERMVADWDDEGEIDLLDWFAELFIYTSSACLIGKRFREELDAHVAELFHDLERGTDAIAFVDPYADIESFRRRDAARVELVELIEGIMDRRERASRRRTTTTGTWSTCSCRSRTSDGNWQFSADVVTGMFISMMFAGHHTTSGTASWLIIELLRNPDVMTRVAERDRRPGRRPAAARSPTRTCGRSRGWSPPSRRRSACTRRSSCCCGWSWSPSRSRASTSPRASWSAHRPRCRTGCPRPSPTPTASTRPATSSPARTTWTTRGTGSPSAPAATAASARRSP